MKKKIISILLAMALVLAYAIPVAATETDQAVTDPAPAEVTEPLENNVYEDEIITVSIMKQRFFPKKMKQHRKLMMNLLH